ncbi:MAG: hypothetical protein QOD75_464 [Blastocatellia bacterium]|nr:hypothetical protein [Blastocatellia bacterium]
MKTFSHLLLAAVFIMGLGLCSAGRPQTPAGSVAPTADASLDKLLDRVRQKLEKYREGLFNITVVEVVTQQELHADSTPKGKPRSMVYELVTLHRQSAVGQQDPAPIITRTLKSVDGKPARNPTLPRRSKCVDTNPAPAYGDPLSFLLADYPIKFIYAYAGEAEIEGRKTAMVSITTPPPAEAASLVEKDDCFRLSRGLRRKATIWIDIEGFDVLKLKWELIEPFTGKMPAGVTRIGILPLFRPRREVSFEKSDFVMHFRPIDFHNPVQTLLLPVSSESTWIIRGGGIAGYKTNTDYTRYRRYLTNVEIKDSDGRD